MNEKVDSTQGQPEGQPKVEDTGYFECPICQQKVKKGGQHGHFQAAHPKEDYDEYKDQFTPTAPPEGGEEKEKEGKKEGEKEGKIKDIPSREEEMLNEVNEYMEDVLPTVPGFPSKSKKKLDFLKWQFKRQRLWQSPDRFRRFANLIMEYCPKVKWNALQPVLDDLWGIVQRWQPPSGSYYPSQKGQQGQGQGTRGYMPATGNQGQTQPVGTLPVNTKTKLETTTTTQTTSTAKTARTAKTAENPIKRR